jgi:hypothetical protein
MTCGLRFLVRRIRQAESERMAGSGVNPAEKRECRPGSPPRIASGAGSFPLWEFLPMPRTSRTARFDFRKRVSYDPGAKRLFHNHARRRLFKLAEVLGFTPGTYDLRARTTAVSRCLAKSRFTRIVSMSR